MILSKLFWGLLLWISSTSSQTNCKGCFNPEQGICLLNPNNTCIPFTKSQCIAKGKPWQWSNTSLNSWPKGCLSLVEAQGFACGGLLPLCPEENYYLPHANSSKNCEKNSKVEIVAFNNLSKNPESYNCFAIKNFGAGCVWEDWKYYGKNAKGTFKQKKLC